MIALIFWIAVSPVTGHDLVHILQKWASFPLFTSRSSLSSPNEFANLFQDISWDIKLKILSEQKLDLVEVTNIPLGLLYILPSSLLPEAENTSDNSLISLLLRQNIDSEPKIDIEERFRHFLEQGDSFHVTTALHSNNGTSLQSSSDPCQLVPYLDLDAKDCQVSPVFPRQQNCLNLRRFVNIERPVHLWSMPTIHKIGPLLYCLPSAVLSRLPAIKMMLQDGMNLNIANRYWSRAQNQSIFRIASKENILPDGLKTLVPAKLILDGALSNAFDSIQSMHDLMRTMPFLSSYACFLHCKRHLQFLTKPEKMLPFLDFLPSFQLRHYASILLLHLQSTKLDLTFDPKVYVQLLEVWIELEQDDWLDILLSSPSLSFQRIIQGLSCSQVKRVPTTLMIPMIHLFNQRSQHLPHLKLRSCLVKGVEEVLLAKSRLEPTEEQSALDQLEPLEIQVIGGYLLSALQPSKVSEMTDMHKQMRILKAISEESLSNLLRVLDKATLEQFANLLLNDLTLLSIDVSEIDMGSLLYFLDLNQFQSNDQTVKSLVPRLKGPICTDETNFNAWSTILQILWDDVSTVTTEDLYNLGDSIVLLPLTKIKEIDKKVLAAVAPYIFEQSHYIKEFRFTEHDSDIQLLGQCATFLNNQGMDPRFIQLRVFHTLRYLETFMIKPLNTRSKRDVSTRELDRIRRGFEAAREYWKYLHDNNLLTQDQKDNARIIFSNFVQEIVNEQRKLLNLNDSVSDKEVSETLHNLVTEGLLSESIEQELHEFSDRLRVKVMHQVENVLQVNFAHPKFLPDGPLKSELQDIFGLNHEETTTISTTEDTHFSRKEQETEIPFDLFEGLDQLLVDTMLDHLDSPTEAPKSILPQKIEKSVGQSSFKSFKDFQEFKSKAKISEAISGFKLDSDQTFISEQTLKTIDESTVKQWSIHQILANLDHLGRTNELSTSSKSIMWNKIRADLIPGTNLGSTTIINLGDILRVVDTAQFFNVTALISQDFGFEAIRELSSKLENGAKLEFARQVDDMLNCRDLEFLKMLMASVQPIWCNLNPEHLEELLNGCPEILDDLLSLFQSMSVCSEGQNQTLAAFLNSAAHLFGPANRWSSSDLASLGTLVGGLGQDVLQQIPPLSWRGLTDLGYQQLPRDLLLTLSSIQKEHIPVEIQQRNNNL